MGMSKTVSKTVVTLLLVFLAHKGISQGIVYQSACDSISLSKRSKTQALQTHRDFNLDVPVVPQNFYVQQLGFFCRQELKMQEAHIPLSFRLGSLEYCNWMEQKPGYR
jgi:hypothetical protein